MSSKSGAAVVLYLLTFSCLPLCRLLLRHSKVVGLFLSSGLSKFLFGSSHLSHYPFTIISSTLVKCKKCCTAYSCGAADASYSIQLSTSGNQRKHTSLWCPGKLMSFLHVQKLEWNGNNMGLVGRKIEFENQLYHLLTISSFKKLYHFCLHSIIYKMGGQNVKVINPPPQHRKVNKIMELK